MNATVAASQIITTALTDLGLPTSGFHVCYNFRTGITSVIAATDTAEKAIADNAERIERATRDAGHGFRVSLRGGVALMTNRETLTLSAR